MNKKIIYIFYAHLFLLAFVSSIAMEQIKKPRATKKEVKAAMRDLVAVLAPNLLTPVKPSTFNPLSVAQDLESIRKVSGKHEKVLGNNYPLDDYKYIHEYFLVKKYLPEEAPRFGDPLEEILDLLRAYSLIYKPKEPTEIDLTYIKASIDQSTTVNLFGQSTTVNLFGRYLERDNYLEIPDAISHLTNLKTAKIHAANGELPPKLFMSCLLALHIQESSFLYYLDINNHLSNCTNLTSLKLSSNKLEPIPSVIFSLLTRLRELELDENFISIIPREISKLSLLQTFSLKSCGAYCIPRELFNLPCLTHLNLSGNPSAFTYISPGYACPTLVNLNLSSNNLLTIPQWVFKHPHLQNLDISDNQIAEISDSISLLRSLNSFVIHVNPLSHISPLITYLSYLTTLSFKNHIKKLPRDMIGMTWLQCLGTLSKKGYFISRPLNKWVEKEPELFSQM